MRRLLHAFCAFIGILVMDALSIPEFISASVTCPLIHWEFHLNPDLHSISASQTGQQFYVLSAVNANYPNMIPDTVTLHYRVEQQSVQSINLWPAASADHHIPSVLHHSITLQPDSAIQFFLDYSVHSIHCHTETFSTRTFGIVAPGAAIDHHVIHQQELLKQQELFKQQQLAHLQLEQQRVEAQRTESIRQEQKMQEHEQALWQHLYQQQHKEVPSSNTQCVPLFQHGQVTAIEGSSQLYKLHLERDLSGSQQNVFNVEVVTLSSSRHVVRQIRIAREMNTGMLSLTPKLDFLLKRDNRTDERAIVLQWEMKKEHCSTPTMALPQLPITSYTDAQQQQQQQQERLQQQMEQQDHQIPANWSPYYYRDL